MVQENAIIEQPTFFEYLAYMNCFFTGFVGPYIDYNQHKAFMERKGEYKNIPHRVMPILAGLFRIALFGIIYSTFFDDNKPTRVLE